MGLKYRVVGFNYPADKTPRYEIQTRWFVVAVVWLAIFSVKHDGVDLYRRC